MEYMSRYVRKFMAVRQNALLTVLALWFLLSSFTSYAKIITAGPWLQAATETSVVIMWETALPQPGKVVYGLTSSYGETTVSQPTIIAAANTDSTTDTSAIIHEVKLTGLQPNTTYHYKVGTDGYYSDDNTFRTHGKKDKYRMLHISDSHLFERNAEKAMHSMISYKPDFVILSGDITHKSINNEFRTHFVRGYHLFKNTVHYTCKGNHDDRPWSKYSAWFHNDFPGAFSEDFYAFDIGPIHFVGMNNNMRHKDFPPGSLDWLENNLAKSQARWKIVFMKAHPDPDGKYIPQRVAFMIPIFTKYGVDVVMTGGNADGFAKQINGVWYQHAGVGHNNGYFIVEISDAELKSMYRNQRGAVRETFTIHKELTSIQMNSEIAGQGSHIR